MKRPTALLALCFALAGCATNPMTGRSQFVLLSEDQAISGSASAYTSMIGGLSKKGKVEADTPRAARVREITDKLIAQAVRFRPESAGWNWQLTVIHEPKTVNAFCMAGGKMAIYTGMWEKLHATDDEIANVMGHEIGHALASHTRERMSIGLATGIGATLLAVAVSRDSRSASRNQETLALAAALAITLPNSRESESEADQIGIELAARAGFDPRAAVTLWQKMSREGGSPPEFLSTHPAPQHRMQRLAELAPRMDPFYQVARTGIAQEQPPSFLGVSSNERKLEPVSREQYAARVAAEPDTLSFVAAPFEKFRRGETVLECRAACAVGYGLQRGDWKKMHAAKAWRDLAVSVIKVCYLNDLSYFLLGEAAKGLGAADAARTYYARALEAERAGYQCAGAVNTCEGFDIRRAATAALGR